MPSHPGQLGPLPQLRSAGPAALNNPFVNSQEETVVAGDAARTEEERLRTEAFRQLQAVQAKREIKFDSQDNAFPKAAGIQDAAFDNNTMTAEQELKFPGRAEQFRTNRAISQALLRKEDTPEAQKDRLRGIIQRSSDAATRKRAQDTADFQMKKLIEAGADASNPLTAAQYQQGLDTVNSNLLAGMQASPFQIRVREEESDNPSVQAINMGRTIAGIFGKDPEAITALLQIDPKTKAIPAGLGLQVYEKLSREKADQDKIQAKNLENGVKALDKQVAAYQLDSRLFDQNTGKPLANLPPDIVKAYNTVIGQQNELRTRQIELATKGFGIPEVASIPAPTRAAPSATSASAPATATTPTSAQVPASTDPVLLYTELEPLKPESKKDLLNMLPGLQAKANREQRIIYIVDPDTGITHKLPPK